MEASFRHFDGIPEEMLVDNAKALVTVYNAQTREVVFSPTFSAFARYWVSVKTTAPPDQGGYGGRTARRLDQVSGFEVE